MNKIPITDLLNPSSKTQFCKNEIKEINNKLLKICSLLPVNIYDQKEQIKDDLDKIISKLSNLSTYGRFNGEEKYLIKVCYQLTAIVAKFLITDAYTSQQMENQEEESNIFNIVTQDMMNTKEIKQNSCRGHRFSKKNVDILEEWYNKHRNKPYLDKRWSNQLQSQTQLSKTQIKNWVSNKRRKEKMVQVSSEILQLIKEK